MGDSHQRRVVNRTAEAIAKRVVAQLQTAAEGSWKRITDQPILSLLVTIFGVAATFSGKVSAMAPWICLAIMWPLATVWIGRLPEIREARHRKVWVTIAGVMFAACLSFLGYVLRPERSISLVCRVESVPVVNFPPSSGAVLVDPFFRFGSINRWLVRSANGYPPDYSPGGIGRLIYRCDLTNTASVTLLDVSLDVTIVSVASYGSPVQGSMMCDGAFIRAVKHVRVPGGDLPPGTSSVFYFYNGTDNCAELQWGFPTSPEFGVRLKLDEETRHLVSLGPGLLR